MGFLTTITIHNDAFHNFEKHPEQFGNAIINGIGEASSKHKEVDVPFLGYANYISVQPSRHADDHTVYVHHGNTVLNLNPWNTDFKELVERNPDVAEEFVKTAEFIVKEAKKKIKEERNFRKQKLKEIGKNTTEK